MQVMIMKAMLKLTFLLVSVLCFRATAQESDAPGEKENLGEIRAQKGAFNYLVFTQQWPQTVCQIWKEKSSGNQCDIPDTIDTWTVHGIWPSAIKGNDPQFCNRKWKFNINKIQPLIPNLEKYWPNIYLGTSQDDFWIHEWTKHGTCAAPDYFIDGEFAYFNAGIELLVKYNLNEILSTAGIIPSLDNSYLLSDLHNSIVNQLGVAGSISCYKDKETKRYLVKEIRLCLNKDLDVIECPEELLRAYTQADQDCPKSGLILYPPIQPTKFTASKTGNGEL